MGGSIETVPRGFNISPPDWRCDVCTAFFPRPIVDFADVQSARGAPIVTRSAGRGWSITPVEDVLINSRDKVRTSAIAVNRPATWDTKSVGHLPDVALSAFSAVRLARRQLLG